jgi:hypothetical protein
LPLSQVSLFQRNRREQLPGEFVELPDETDADAARQRSRREAERYEGLLLANRAAAAAAAATAPSLMERQERELQMEEARRRAHVTVAKAIYGGGGEEGGEGDGGGGGGWMHSAQRDTLLDEDEKGYLEGGADEHY